MSKSLKEQKGAPSVAKKPLIAQDSLVDQHHYQQIIESMHDYAVISTDLNGVISTWNSGAVRLFGYQPKEVIGKSIEVLFTPRDKSESTIQHVFKAALKSGRTSNERHYVRKDGKRFWSSGMLFPITAKSGSVTGYTKVIRDFTGKKREQEERDRFISLVEHSTDFIALVDIQQQALYLNKAGQRLVGLIGNNLPSVEPMDFFPQHELKRIDKEVYPAIEKEGSWEGEIAFKHFKTGKIIPMHCSLYTIAASDSGEVNSYACVARDITDLKAAQQKVKQSRQQLYDIFTHAPAAIAVMRGQDLVFELANPLFRQLIGTNRPLRGKPLLEAIPELEPDFKQRILEAARTNTPFIASEYPVVLDWHNSGKRHKKYLNLVFEPFPDDKQNYDGLMVFGYEVTDLVRSREKLQQSERRFRQIADSMPQLVWTADPDGKTDYYNRRWYEFTGRARTSTKDIDWIELIDHRDVGRVTTLYKEAMESGGVFQSELRIRPNQDTSRYRWFLARMVPLKDENGTITKWFGTFTDIDYVKNVTKKQKELEVIATRLTEQKAHLVELNNAKDDFISIASHQLRTPATGVKQYLGMLIEGYAGDVPQDQMYFLQTAYESNERQLKIVDDLLKVARVDAGKVKLSLKESDITSMLRNIIEEQRGKFEQRKQVLSFRKVGGPVHALVDEKLLRMALENIIDNASKYSSEGKQVTVTLKKTSGVITVRVKDNGIGIEESDLAKIFQKFSRIDTAISSSVGGTGLGLYWAKNIVDLHGGRIEVKSTLGEGTTFIISLPG